MPIIRQDVIDGPSIQSSGERRGTIEFEFDDGRIIRREVRAPDATSWADLLIDLPADVEQTVQLQDAKVASEGDAEVIDAEPGQASREQIALEYLRQAYRLESPYEAYLKFDKFNNYRLLRGWNVNQVVAGLTSVGLTQEEWDLMLSSYQYLSNPARVTAMEAYQPIAENWLNRGVA